MNFMERKFNTTQDAEAYRAKLLNMGVNDSHITITNTTVFVLFTEE